MLFEREDWTLFRALPTLAQKAGVPVKDISKLIAKELVDNALDAAASPAAVVMQIDGDVISVADDGPGFAMDTGALLSIFSIKRPLRSSKLLRLPTRGAMGNGLRVICGAVASTGGDIIIACNGNLARVTFDRMGEASIKIMPSADVQTGTVVRVYLPGLAIDGSWAELALSMRGGTTYTGKASPHWHTSDSFFELCQAAGDQSVWLLCDALGISPDTVDNDIGLIIDIDQAANQIEDTDALLHVLRAHTQEPDHRGLGGYGKEAFSGGYGRGTGTFEQVAGRGQFGAFIPYVAEAWAEYDGADHEEVDLLISVNRTPITASVRAYRSKAQLAVVGAGVSHYVGNTGKHAPSKLRLTVITPYMPIQSDGKAPDLSFMLKGISSAVETAMKKGRGKRGNLKPYAASQKDTIFLYLDGAVDKASESGRHRFSQRQLYYVMRPVIQDQCGADLNYSHFCAVLTDYENDNGPIPRMYRDARGSLYHPHTGETIPLGTLEVERYERPFYLLNKVLYIEKEGFFPLLIDERWPERHDCALLTSKGQATRAAKDLLDLMGDGVEPITIFCVHDADAYGTGIYQALTEATRSRRIRRKVEVINLGLEPEEALAMGLQQEDMPTGKKHPVADYVTLRWRNWLQKHRVELNAMTTGQFLSWLDTKMAPWDSKVVPPHDVIYDTLRSQVEKRVEAALIAKLMAEHGVKEQASRLAQAAEGSGVGAADIEQYLTLHPTHSWRGGTDAIAQRIASELV
jgi:hypothetical protein